MDRELWVKSGHVVNFGENMFMTQTPDERTFAIKPMNCPGHIQVFKHGLRSYRELPLRLAEIGKVHRYEPSGALHGLMRVRAFTQDDAHIFCTNEQITAEAVKVTELILSIYRDFGFNEVRIEFSDRPAIYVLRYQLNRTAIDLLVEWGRGMTMRAISVDVVRIPTKAPATFPAYAPIETGKVAPSSILAMLGKTEGNGGVNDFTREYAMAAFCERCRRTSG